MCFKQAGLLVEGFEAKIGYIPGIRKVWVCNKVGGGLEGAGMLVEKEGEKMCGVSM